MLKRYKKLNYFPNRSGFTLVELLVSITIFALMTMFVVVNFRAGQKQDFLNLGAEEISNNLKKAQTAAVAGELIEGVVPKGGYGLYFASDSTSYLYFADLDGNFNYTAVDGVIAEYPLPKGVVINSENLSVVFDPPRPKIYFNGSDIEAESEVMIKHQDLPEAVKKIIINSVSGKIDLE
ncbi:MAG: prepilin-type N-terminal cleavage/methylation domain-containing protein [Patescibacteria group bacterium]|nr:prepilin-type N-terminal cleavage/methylation domain-containing protein [Patescibacteria group bacterium]MDD5490661.1 prepilin-type N-terminal cleavage/methylation domain-containing protein [Patescibacteria group bacterium]